MQMPLVLRAPRTGAVPCDERWLLAGPLHGRSPDGPGLVKAALLLFTAALMLLAARPAGASQESERLVADGYVAYQAARYAEAQQLFERAVRADEGDVGARYALGLALTALQRWDAAAVAFEQVRRLRPEFDEARRALEFVQKRRQETTGEAGATAAAKPWEIHATTGVQYDSNVRLEPSGRGSGKADAAFILSGGGQYDVLRRPDTLARLEYDLYQTLHPKIDEFDFRSHRVRGTVSRALRPDLWAGVQGGYDHDTLGSHSYLSEPSVMPFLSFLEGSRGLSQVSYRRGWATYLSAPFHDLRDGPNDAVAASQTFYWGSRSLDVGYQYGEERPTRAVGNDYRFVSHEGSVGGGFPAWFGTTVDLRYLFRYDDYTRPNSFAGFRKTRLDVAHEFYAGVKRPIASHLNAALVYYGTINDSNIGIFEYRRHVVSALLEVTY